VLVAHAIILAIWEAEIRRILVLEPAWKIVHETLYQKIPNQKRACGVAQLVEHLSSKREALITTPSIAKKKKKKNPQYWKNKISMVLM
jgi:23S rRNA maturation mini-RNase III